MGDTKEGPLAEKIRVEVRALEERVSWAECETTKMGQRALAAEEQAKAWAANCGAAEEREARLRNVLLRHFVGTACQSTGQMYGQKCGNCLHCHAEAALAPTPPSEPSGNSGELPSPAQPSEGTRLCEGCGIFLSRNGSITFAKGTLCSVCAKGAHYLPSPAPAPTDDAPRDTEADKERINRFQLAVEDGAAPSGPRVEQGELTFAHFRAVNVERAKAFPSAKQNWTAADWMTALVGEVGELANLLKKRRRGVDLSRGQSMAEIEAQLPGELGDIQTYLDLLAANLGVDLGAATVEKFDQVSERVGSPLRLGPPPRAALDSPGEKP